jgi:hypothetical protein
MDERHFKEELSATQPMLQSPIPAEPRHQHLTHVLFIHKTLPEILS